MTNRKRRSPTHDMFVHSLCRHLFFILLPLMIFSAVMLVYHFQTQTRKAESVILSTSQTLQDYAENLFDQNNQLMLSLYQTDVYSEIASMLRSEQLSYDNMLSIQLVLPWLGAYANAGDIIDSIYIYVPNKHGRFLSSGSVSLTTLDAYYDTGWYDECVSREGKDALWVTSRSYARYHGLAPTELVTVYRSIMNGRCFMIMNLSTESLRRTLQRFRVFEGQEILITDPQGNVLLSTAEDGLAMTPAAWNGENYHTSAVDGVYRISFPIWNRSCCLTLLVPGRVVYKDVLVQLTFSCVMLGGCILLCVLLALHHARKEEKKLRALYALVDSGPAQPQGVKPYDIYSMIEQNMVSSFMRQSHLELELQKRSYAMKSMELLALQAQINPHFLVNTLNTIYYMTLEAADGREHAACHMIEDLSELLGLLTGNPNEPIFWRQEIQCLHNYIAIQKYRFSDRFEYTETIDETCLEWPITKLLLQPIVENCLVHAMPEDRTLHIHLDIRVNDGMQVITVTDDGIGMTDEQLNRLREHLNADTAYRHIGLLNVMKRLRLLYNLEDPLSITQRPEGGTAVRICLPAQKLG